MCAELGVSRSGFYAWRTRPESDRARTDAELRERIASLHEELRGNPGVRRMRAELNSQGIRIGLKRVWRLMKAAGLRGRHPRRWKRTTVAGDTPVTAPDLIGRDFTATAADLRWCGDF